MECDGRTNPMVERQSNINHPKQMHPKHLSRHSMPSRCWPQRSLPVSARRNKNQSSTYEKWHASYGFRVYNGTKVYTLEKTNYSDVKSFVLRYSEGWKHLLLACKAAQFSQLSCMIWFESESIHTFNDHPATNWYHNTYDYSTLLHNGNKRLASFKVMFHFHDSWEEVKSWLCI